MRSVWPRETEETARRVGQLIFSGQASVGCLDDDAASQLLCWPANLTKGLPQLAPAMGCGRLSFGKLFEKMHIFALRRRRAREAARPPHPAPKLRNGLSGPRNQLRSARLGATSRSLEHEQHMGSACIIREPRPLQPSRAFALLVTSYLSTRMALRARM
eukprot:1721569-Pleurochrysis_carterae.AAC.1